jgi:AcrR family transcriptional regulator
VARRKKSGTARKKKAGAPRGTGTREQITLSAIELFAEHGYANTTLEDIAAAVGIKKPSIYHYIKTKEDLLFEVHQLLAQEVIDEVQSLLADAPDPAAKLRAFFRSAVRLVDRRQLEMTIFLNETHTVTRSRRWKEINAKRDAYQKMFEAVLDEGMRSGAFRKLPTTLTALGTLGMVTWTYRWYQADGAGPDEIADLYADIVLDGIRK